MKPRLQLVVHFLIAAFCSYKPGQVKASVGNLPGYLTACIRVMSTTFDKVALFEVLFEQYLNLTYIFVGLLQSRATNKDPIEIRKHTEAPRNFNSRVY
jgi:hypothetical protein